MIAFLPKNHSLINKQETGQYIYIYSFLFDELFSIEIGNDTPVTLTWSKNDSSLYFACIKSSPKIDEDEWKDVIQYRENSLRQKAVIYQIHFNFNDRVLSTETNIIRNLSLLIGKLVYVSFFEKLIFSSVSNLIEDMNDFELYSIDLRNSTAEPSRLTYNEGLEFQLQVSNDGQYLLFRMLSLGSNKELFNHTQYRLYSLNLIDNKLTRLAEHFEGNINQYAMKSDSSIYILGQLGTEVHVYSQDLSMKDLVYHNGWNGTYELIACSRKNQSIAFVYSSFERSMEIYLINDITELKSAQSITDENQLITERNLPKIEVYSWKNDDDHRTIEGILHYPPEKFQSKNLPLLVFIHGGPYWASLNSLDLGWYQWTTLAASQGWLVLEPNYRGSTGYGDQFLNEIRYKPLSRPGKDILYGIDQLIKDGIVDRNRLAIGGYSYGGFLTNWLITQTKRFNAALSGAGVVDFTSAWATMDLPILLGYLFGELPWKIPHTYLNESPIYQLDRVCTPTHIVTGEKDVRVPAAQSYMLERGLHFRNIPVKLITFPKEGHSLRNNPWHGKIKVREELKWLQKYGNQSCTQHVESTRNHSIRQELTYYFLFLFFFIM